MNVILDALSAADRAEFLPELEEVDLRPRLQLECPSRPIRHIYFLDSGIAVVQSVTGMALGLIGVEGSTGIAIIMATDRASHATTMLTGGHGLRIAPDPLRRALHQCEELRRLLLRFAMAFNDQVASIAAPSTCKSVDQRVARCILMISDRVGDTVTLTHWEFSYMLHARRASVSVAIKTLRDANLIDGGRGAFRVLDRSGLEALPVGFKRRRNYCGGSATHRGAKTVASNSSIFEEGPGAPPGPFPSVGAPSAKKRTGQRLKENEVHMPQVIEFESEHGQ